MTDLRQRQPRIECAGFLAFVRTRPCCACGATGRTQAAHIRMGSLDYGKRETGAGEKPSDQWAVPLCGPDLGRALPGCHAEQHSMNEARFWERWSAEWRHPFEVAARLWAQYTSEHPRAAGRALSKAPRRKAGTLPKRLPRAIGAPARGKRKIAGPASPWPAKGTRKLKGRGFRK